ncbi:MAG: hypothetical protein HYZ11_11395 [Candidatus Tectomicrobia bacterium]|uniref:Lectin n=1 Tax=Tectimicrobiota bacterium TaxID=2528274 RepID=A0A932MN06_UNCTE|nr:hypothetical protein [Candidatus Tectomicrobia bacterium]
MVRRTRLILLGAAIASFLWGGSAQAQQSAPPRTPPQFPNMTFFISSTSGPDGANFGGIEGADRHCQALAAKAGAGKKTWRAYLSTQAAGGKPAVNARDRIGKGPWVNTEGVQVAANVDELHSNNNKINVEIGRSENGRRIPGRLFVVNQHDVLTGSTVDGRAFPPEKDLTCGNWTKNGEGAAMVGHHDRMGLRDDAPSKSWNSSHPSRGCGLAALKSSGGAGLLYCFAAN